MGTEIKYMEFGDLEELEKFGNDLATDLSMLKTTTDSLVTLGTELRTDHGTTKTTVDGLVTLTSELHDDHATFKTAADGVETLIEELHDDHALIKSWTDESDGDQDVMNNLIHYAYGTNGVTGGTYTLTAGAAVTLTGAGFIEYMIGGERYYGDLHTTIDLALSTNPIADGRFGAWRILIDRTGTTTTQGAAADQQFTSAEDALLTLSSIAQTANTACIGYLTLGDVGDTFVPQTDNLSDCTNIAIYYERKNRKIVTGLTAAPGAATTLNAGATTINLGTRDFMLNGARLAQIAAAAAHASGDDASTVAAGTNGAWLVVTDFAGTGYYVLAATGVAGAVSAMNYATSALANTAIANVQDNLPSMFCPIARINVANASAGLFTIGATNWNAASMTSTVTDCTWGTYDRTTTAGFDSHHVTLPSIPASITATLLATLTAAKPASAPATLSASKASAGPATISASAPTSTSTLQVQL
jgi:hypothetical protein